MKHLYFLVALSAVSGCAAQPHLNVYEVVLLEKYNLPLVDNQPSVTKNLYLENGTALYVSDRNNHSIVRYNLPDKSIDSIFNIPIKAYDNQFDFVVTGDSIIVFFDPAKTTSYDHDSCIFIFNQQFDTLAIYGIQTAHPRIIGNAGARENGNWLYSSRFFMPSIYGAEKLFFTLQFPSRLIADEQFLNEKLPVGGHLDIRTGKAKTHEVRFPGEVGVYFPVETIDPYQCLNEKKHCIIYGFRHSNILYVCDLKTENCQTVNISDSRLVTSDTQKGRYNEPNDRSNDPSADRPYHLVYDKYNSCYYRFFIYRNPPSTVPSSETQKYGVEILDQNFGPLGYSRLPSNFSITWPRPFVTENGILFQSTTSSQYKSGIVQYSLVELLPTKNTNVDSLFILNDLDSTFFEEGIHGYISKLISSNIDKKVLIFPYDATCPSCIKWFKVNILQNAASFESNNLVIILQGSPGFEFNLYQNELKSVTNALRTDTNNLLTKYSPNGLFNPTLFEVEESTGKYEKVKIYNPHEKHLLLELFNKRSKINDSP